MATPKRGKSETSVRERHADRLAYRSGNVLPEQTAPRRETLPTRSMDLNCASILRTRPPQKPKSQRSPSLVLRHVPGSVEFARSARENKSGRDKNAGA